MRLALAQINPTVGDLEGNLEKIVGCAERAAALGSDLVCFPELALTGYPPEDLLLKPSFLKACRRALERLAAATRSLDLALVVGFPDSRQGDTYNAAAIIHRGSQLTAYRKIHLPNYGVFDEKRYFQGGDCGLVLSCREVRVGVTICEDLWHPSGPVVLEACQARAELILNLSASPYHRGKRHQREEMLSVRARDNIAYFAFINQVGGQDELVFDGSSSVFDEQGRLVARAAAFREDLLAVDIPPAKVHHTRIHDIRHRDFKILPGLPGKVKKVMVSPPSARNYPPLPAALREEPASDEAEVYAALVLGLRDYIKKNGFSRTFVGLSGGVDSSLTAAIAVDALGREQVTGVLMPSPYTSRESREDAAQLAAGLGIELLEIPIHPIFESYLRQLGPALDGPPADTAAQNLQARIRGNLLMGLANHCGGVVLTTGNKSELSVGYATLYGDMAGGFAVLKDLTKTLVYRLCRHLNHQAGKTIIPPQVLEKAPTAELKPNQKTGTTCRPTKSSTR